MVYGYLVTWNNSATYGLLITSNSTFSPKKLENYLREQKIMFTFAGILC